MPGENSSEPNHQKRRWEELCKFKVDGFRKHWLVNGLDDIELTLQKDDLIAEYEKRGSIEGPWLDVLGTSASTGSQ
ncbi:hypothetical protein L211DRAFT_402052 [Terfezia boudieri ATCC MYA-4762]|uniref:Uncharacterized protein n=1 Tax=Terfezia boudieri ATCC MYA-4762 TaxID=1051890 RepID=A0A3N4M6V4_9PEZI|nr:hypothetical protein L211DRAFT_402052 [Terfezia boudieri ATCC MYA-4762]